MMMILEAFLHQLTGDDEGDPPLSRLAVDMGHLAGPALAWVLLHPMAGVVVAALMGGKQVVDGWRPGHGRRGGSFVDLGLVAVSLTAGWLGAPWGGVCVVSALLAVSALRAWQQRRWSE